MGMTDITIKLLEKPNKYQLVIQVGKEPSIEGEPFPTDRLTKIKERFLVTLNTIRLKHKKDGCSQEIECLSHLLREIQAFSIYLSDGVLGKDASCLLQQQLFKLIAQKIDQPISLEQPIGRIIYEPSNFGDYLPLEYLFVRNTEVKKIVDLKSAILSLSQILGFCFMVQRRNPKNSGSIQSISFDKILTIDIYAYNKLRHVSKEIKFFRNNPQHFEIRANWPEEYKNVPQTLIDKLIKSSSKIQHFICHCDTSGKNDWEHYLKFGGKRAEIGELRTCYDCSNAQPKNKFCDNIIFLNACASASVKWANIVTFPRLFLDTFGYKGFIGTEYPIFDNFAYEFAKIFYANLLKEGQLDIALFKTRWFFAKKCLNLMGLFYTLYAEPNLKLSRTVDSIHV